MTREQYNEACRFANQQLEKWRVSEALRFIELHLPMPGKTHDIITDAMDEWCKDHDIDPDEWMEWGCSEDVFFNEG